MLKEPNSARLLLIDDDAMSRELLCLLLGSEGYQVQSADSGEAALELLQHNPTPPDLVLTDVQMPGIRGARLARELRGCCGPRTLLLAMSASRPTEEVISGYDQFLLKPFEIEAIADTLRAPRPPGHAANITLEAPTAQRRKRARAVAAAVESSSAAAPIPIPASAAKSASKNSMSSHAPTAEAAIGAPTAVPMLNEEIYGKLAASMPAQQLLEMYSMCLNDARSRIAGMRRLADAHEGLKFSREAHAIKGGCGMLGATELHRMAAALERNGPDEAPAREPDVNSLDELSDACDRLERMLRSRV
jgi:CheY-like chemotaxis protein/HPt (histidine-containing phosphotransfer) domain-containing protein